MKVGILGSGIVGQQLGLGFIRLGNEVMIGTRDKSKLNDWQKVAGEKGSVGSFEDAAKFGDVNVLSTFWAGTENAIMIAGAENFSGKVIIDTTNPLDFSNGPPPKFDASVGNSAGEQVQKWMPGAKVVKAFNTIGAHIMIHPERESGEDPDLLIAGNYDDAKKSVTALAKQLGWKSVIDIGDISQSFFLEAFAHLWIIYGFKFNNWTHAFKLIKK